MLMNECYYSRYQRNGEYPCAGDIAIYNSPEERKEEISIKGPIKEDIQLQVRRRHWIKLSVQLFRIFH